MTLLHLIPLKIQWGRQQHATHFMGETAETQRIHITCPMSQSWQAKEQVLNPGIDSRAHTSKHEANGFHLKEDQNIRIPNDLYLKEDSA